MSSEARPDAADPTRFRNRGEEVSRIEAFSDVVFGFALTLLVVSVEVPRTYQELMDDMRGFIPFAISFAILAFVWWSHHKFFRRYGLDDVITATLNFVLLFVVLFYVYPLKFMFNGVMNDFTGHSTVRDAGGMVVPWVKQQQVPTLFLIYGLGYATVFLVFLLLYWHALRMRIELDLNEFEEYDTRTSILECACLSLVSVAVALTALILPVRISGLAGFVYFTIPIFMTMIGMRRGQQRRKLQVAWLARQPVSSQHA